MVRDYNSRKRQEAAEQTRRDILRAALKLHWEGVTEYDAIAGEAGCSAATVRKHFPTKEDLFQGCTRAFAENLDMPDLNALSRISDANQRIQSTVQELCRIHEAMFGYAWLSARLGGDSPTLEAEMAAYAGLTDAVAELLAPAGSDRSGVVRGLLDFLTYRALRLSGELTDDEAAEALTTAITSLLNGQDEDSGRTPSRRARNHEAE